MRKWYLSIINIGLVLLLFVKKGRCENITLSKINIEDNKPFEFNQFIYNNKTKSNKLPNAGFEYTLTISSNNHESSEGAFYIFLFNRETISSFSNLKCNKSSEDGMYYDQGNSKRPLTLLELGVYNRKIEVSKGTYTYSDTTITEFSGVSKTVFFYCSYNTSQSSKPFKLELSGKFSFYNKMGFSSAEDFYLINLYFILTVYYGLTSLYWLVKMVMNYKTITTIMTLFSIAIPFVILENIFRLEFFSITKSQGSLSLPFKILAIIFRLIKNEIFRFVFFLLAHKYYKAISIKNKAIIIPLLFLYLGSAVLFEIASMKHNYFSFSFLYFLIALFTLEAINGGLWFILYKQFKKVSQDNRLKNVIAIQEEIAIYMNMIKYSFIITILHFALYLILKVIQGSFAICYIKWIVDLIHQSISIIIFSGLLFTIKGKDLVHDGYINETDLDRSTNEGEMHSRPEVHG